MAIVKMKKLKLMVASPQREELLRELMLLGCVEVSEPSTELQEESFLNRVEVPELIQLRTQHTTLSNAIALLNRYAPQKSGLLSSLPEVSTEVLLDESTLAKYLEIADTVISLDDRIRRLTAEESVKHTDIEALTPWADFDLPLECRGTDTSALVLATLPSSVEFAQATATLAEATERAELFKVWEDKALSYVALVCFRDDLDSAQSALRPLGFTGVNLDDYKGTAAENIAAAEKALSDMAKEKDRCAAEIIALAEHRAEMKLRTDTLATKVSREEAASRLMCTDNVSVLEGWLPADKETEFAVVADKYDCAWSTEDPVEDEYPEVPVSLKNGPITRSLNTVTEMYSLPAYNGVDPNPLMAPFFILFYGMMMADMGYGLLMMLGCGLVLKKKKPRNKHFFELFFWCGISTLIWGAVTGGFFGDAPLQVAKILNPNTTWQGLPALFNPLDDALAVLLGSLALGLAQIFTGMAISMVKQIKRGETMAALCNEGAWFVVFAILGVSVAMGTIKQGLIAILIVLVLTQGYGKEGIGGKLMGIGGSLYNNLTGYFSDILSYSRLMALMLAGAVIAQVFNTLGAITGNIFLFLLISIVGNALNMGLNLLGCYVHDLRLQCLEYFGRFYEDGGKPFRPLSMETEYVDVVK